MNRALPIALLVTSSLLGACDKTSAPTAGSAAPATGTGATTAAQPAKASPEKEAFFMGRKLGFVSAFELSGAKDKSATALSEANVFATKLGVGPLPAAAPGGGDIEPTAAKLKAAHGAKAEGCFLFGYYLTDSWFGAELGAKVDVPLQRAEAAAANSGIPDTLWKAKLTAIKAAPTSAAISALAKEIEAHFK